MGFPAAGDDDPAGFDLDDVYDPDTLALVDAGPANNPAVDGTAPSRLANWSRSTAMGMVLTGVALGLQEVLDPAEQRPIVIEVDDAGQPGHLPVELFLDPDSPSGSLCLVHREAFPTPAV